VRLTAFVMDKQKLSFNHIVYVVLPKSVFIFLKLNIYTFHASVLFLAFHNFLEKNRHFTLKSIPMCMVILSVTVNQGQEESSVLPMPSQFHFSLSNQFLPHLLTDTLTLHVLDLLFLFYFTSFPLTFYYYNYNYIIIIIIIIICITISCHRPFLPGTSLEPVVIPTTQASNFKLQYFLYYV
jgi:hypothetical protein